MKNVSSLKILIAGIFALSASYASAQNLPAPPTGMPDLTNIPNNAQPARAPINPQQLSSYGSNSAQKSRAAIVSEAKFNEIFNKSDKSDASRKKAELAAQLKFAEISIQDTQKGFQQTNELLDSIKQEDPKGDIQKFIKNIDTIISVISFEQDKLKAFVEDRNATTKEVRVNAENLYQIGEALMHKAGIIFLEKTSQHMKLNAKFEPIGILGHTLKMTHPQMSFEFVKNIPNIKQIAKRAKFKDILFTNGYDFTHTIILEDSEK